MHNGFFNYRASSNIHQTCLRLRQFIITTVMNIRHDKIKIKNSRNPLFLTIHIFIYILKKKKHGEIRMPRYRRGKEKALITGQLLGGYMFFNFHLFNLVANCNNTDSPGGVRNYYFSC
jgi:hypothetical protein